MEERSATKMQLALALFLCAGPNVLSQCPQRVEMKTYTICFPGGWRVYRDEGLDRVSGCSEKDGNCTANGGGYPYPGVAFLFLMPAENVPGHPRYRSARDIALTAAHAGAPDPQLVELRIEGRPASASFAARSLNLVNVWDDVYGLEIDKKLFRGWAEYNNEPQSVDSYRNIILQILSSVSPLKAGDR